LNTKPKDPYLRDRAALPSDNQLPATPPSKLRWIFFGADGLRVGWGLLLFIVPFLALEFAVGTVVNKLYPPTTGPMVFRLRDMIIAEPLMFLTILLITWVISKIERRPITVYGLGDFRWLQHFLVGLAWGVTSVSLLVLTLWKTGLLVIERRLLSGTGILRYGALWLLVFLFVGLFEENYARGYPQYTLTRGLAGFYRWAFKTRHSASFGFWTAALVISILFSGEHASNRGESPIGLLTVVLVAMVFCLSLWRTGSLWWAIGFHAAWDWSESFLYGVADSGLMAQHHLYTTHPIGKPILSGGATGPEGSIFIIPILILVSLGILFTLPRAERSYSTKLPDRRLEA
jgi:uncharacterized protein